ncbi:MAG: UPF0280 family protein [Rhizobiaceae bacterium]|nr:UPF0280 family protein [Rhizobiaceae bacterium]
MTGPQAAMLGRRLHLNHGPIDIIAEAFGEPAQVRRAYERATDRFSTILEELVRELPELRSPVEGQPRDLAGHVAQKMEAATNPFFPEFITPMAAVAGAVADEILRHMLQGNRLSKAYVNNGGDSAIWLGNGETMKLAIAGTGNGFKDRIAIESNDNVRGVATSGWRGRSFSLGIADAVTVLAATAAQADAAATIIANAVDLPNHPAVKRAPAASLQPDSDLRGKLVTVSVGHLALHEVDAALESGLRKADGLRRAGLIAGAALYLDGQKRLTQNFRHQSQIEKTATPPMPQKLAGCR